MKPLSSVLNTQPGNAIVTFVLASALRVLDHRRRLQAVVDRAGGASVSVSKTTFCAPLSSMLTSMTKGAPTAADELDVLG